MKFEHKMYIINMYHNEPEISWDELTCRYLEHFQIMREDKNYETGEVTLVPTWERSQYFGCPYVSKMDVRHIETIVGLHLQRVCRSRKNCPYKALLPEWEEDDEEI